MKLLDIIQLSKDEVTAGGELNLYTPDTTIWKFARKGFQEIVSFFPLTKVISVQAANAQNFFDIPQAEEVDKVIEVLYLESKDRGFNFDAQELFFATSSYMKLTDDLEDWIMYKRNLRAYQVLVGAELEWQQSKQNPHRVFIDNVPAQTVGFTIKYTVNEGLPDTEPDSDDENNVDIPEPQSTYLNRYLLAKIKLTEGAILSRFKPSGQAVVSDGQTLKQEGKSELQDVQQEIKKRGYSLLSL